jgi:hypothetical protein
MDIWLKKLKDKIMKKLLPIGIQTLSKIINNNYIYVDKTEIIYKLITEGEYYFLSRPRRFGKSLTVSTLEEIFSGNKELFKDCWIYNSDWKWGKYPIIKIDFSSISEREYVEQGLHLRLNEITKFYDIELNKDFSLADKMNFLIKIRIYFIGLQFKYFRKEPPIYHRIIFLFIISCDYRQLEKRTTSFESDGLILSLINLYLNTGIDTST